MLPRDEVVDHNVECELRDENCEKRREQSGLEDGRREGEEEEERRDSLFWHDWNRID